MKTLTFLVKPTYPDDDVSCVACNLKGCENTIEIRGDKHSWLGLHDRCYDRLKIFETCPHGVKGVALACLRCEEARLPRCLVTGNLCGTDTWAWCKACPCDHCQTWLEKQQVFALVKDFFEGDEEKAALWMRTANPGLGGIKPVDLLELRPGKTLKWVKERLRENER